MSDWSDIADGWRSQRTDRLRRRELDLADFAALAEAGWYDCVVPTDRGGRWDGVAASTRPIAEAIRTLAAGDPSPTLVAAMHPAVVGFWVANAHCDDPAFVEQLDAVLASAARGERWGTITSEPGSGGDVLRTTTAATPVPDATGPLPGRVYELSGTKHFGSGTGTCHYMFTTAVPEGEREPAAFVIDTTPLVDGGTLDGFEITAPWDGMGMTATQSHGARLDHCRAIRVEWPGALSEMVLANSPLSLAVFSGAVLGILDEAWRTARDRLHPHRESMRPYEQVEWSRITNEYWLAKQAFDGMLRSIEHDHPIVRLQSAVHAKVAMAELAESMMTRVGRVVGGGTFSERSPFASWFEDVRALGFLRPPWGLAFDGLFPLSW